MKIVQIPSKIWVEGYEFALRLLPHDDPILKVEGKSDEEDGMCLTGIPDFSVCVSNDLDARHRLRIVLHEITHAINWASGIDETENLITEEDIATNHGDAWARFWLDNPRFERWMGYTLARIRNEQRTGRNPSADKPTEGKEKLVDPKTE